MLSRRHRGVVPNGEEEGDEHGFGKDHSPHASRNGNGNGDLESGMLGNGNGNGHAHPVDKPKLFRFRDAANTALEDKRREDLKRQLLHGIDRRNLEQFRKSDEEVSL